MKITRYKKSVTLVLNKPAEVIKHQLQKGNKIEFGNDNVIEIRYKPSFFNAFEAKGLLRLNLTSIDINNTKIICEIIPINSSRESFYVLLSILFLWTIASLIISFSLNILMIIITGWIMIFLIIRLSQILNIGKLENKASYVLNQLH